ncbi:MAG: hypothetical protein Q4A17_08790 [Thermoguttaceae bacterium]|nr:hypothetical protein [Thermoguttaceae bacterium]
MRNIGSAVGLRLCRLARSSLVLACLAFTIRYGEELPLLAVSIFCPKSHFGNF